MQKSIKNWQKAKIEASRTFQSLATEQVNALVFKARTGRCVTLVDGTELIDFVSCSYLGLDLDPRIIQASQNSIAECGVTFPAARTRMRAQSFIVLRDLLNQLFCKGKSTIFSTLHMGHLGLLPMLGSGTLPSFPMDENGFVFIVDKTVHASLQIQRALMQQFGSVLLVDFKDRSALRDASEKAHAAQRTPVTIADSVGSMGGFAPVRYLFELAEQYKGYVYLDDAHGTSIFGQHGCGYVLEVLGNKFHPRLILAASLSKAFGGIAGIIVLPTQADAALLERYASTYIFSGPPALSIIDAAIAAAKIHLSGEIHTLQEKLRVNLAYFDSLLQQHVINQDTPFPIRGVYVGNEFSTIALTKALRKQGFAVTAALYPTVAKNQSMIRVALSSAHNKTQILTLCTEIKNQMRTL